MMKMLSLSTYSHALVHKGFIGSPSLNTLGTLLPQSSENPFTGTRIFLKNYFTRHCPFRGLVQTVGSGDSATASAGATAGGINTMTTEEGPGMLGNHPMPPEERNDPFSGSGLLRERMPKHVAVTFDGNRKWSQAKNSGQLTYEPLYRQHIMLADLCLKWGIPVASSFSFSTCTWKRTDEANNLVFSQLQASLEANLKKFMRQGIRVTIIGEKWKLPKSVQDVINHVEEATKMGTALDFRYAVPYGGRWDIVEAARSISKKVKEREIKPKDIDEALVEQELSTGIVSVPNPDLMIRCAATHMISNFYLWQASHAELYFTDILGPDFEESGFIEALHWFQQCERRFGK